MASSSNRGGLFARLLTGAAVGLAGGAILVIFLGNAFPEPIPILGAGGLVGGTIAAILGMLDWMAGPPPKVK